MKLPKKLPNFMCRIIGHKDHWLHYEDWKRLGIVSVCLRCGKGYTIDGWTVPDALERLRRLYPEEEVKDEQKTA